MTELEKKDIEIEKLKKLLVENGITQKEKSKAFSDIKIKDLRSLVTIKKIFDDKIFENWFDNEIIISEDIEIFLQDLINEYKFIMSGFNEDTLKVKFIGTILNRVKFADFNLEINDFYHKSLTYKKDKINFNGYCDFYVAKGLDEPETPYFFIQEYKPSAGGSHPEPQLLAELIAAVELNSWKTIRGCYIIGINWNFVILEKLGEDRYQYFVSKTFNSTNIDDMKDIYRNLLFVKNEIIEMVKRDI
jgi:hypothetical protein